MRARKRLLGPPFVALLLGLLGLWLLRGRFEAPSTGVALTPVLGVGLWDQATSVLALAGRSHGIELRAIDVDKIGEDPLVTPGGPLPRLILVLDAPVDRLAVYRSALRDLHASGCKIIAVDARGGRGAILGEGVVEKDDELARYWRAGGRVNLARMMGYVAARYLGGKNAVEPPVPVPAEGAYRPGAEETFATVALGRSFERGGFAVYGAVADAAARLRDRLAGLDPDRREAERPADGSASSALGAAGAQDTGSPHVEGFAMREAEPRPQAAPPEAAEDHPGLWAAGGASSVVALAFGAGVALSRPRRRAPDPRRRPSGALKPYR